MECERTLIALGDNAHDIGQLSRRFVRMMASGPSAGPDDAAALAYVWYRRRSGAPKAPAVGQIANT